jgi:hypothetical protein
MPTGGTRRRLALILVIAAVGIALVGVIAWGDISWLKSDQWFTVWMTVLTVVGAFGAVFLGSLLALRQAHRDEVRGRVDGALSLLAEYVAPQLDRALVEMRNTSDAGWDRARERAETDLRDVESRIDRFCDVRGWLLPEDAGVRLLSLQLVTAIARSRMSDAEVRERGQLVEMLTEVYSIGTRVLVDVTAIGKGERPLTDFGLSVSQFFTKSTAPDEE